MIIFLFHSKYLLCIVEYCYVCLIFYTVMCVPLLVLCVLFVCKCVLYCCHWVSTQLQLKIYILRGFKTSDDAF
jgi:hypothetical protein